MQEEWANRHSTVNAMKSLSPAEQLSLDKTPNTHDLKEERFILANGFNPGSVGSRTGMSWVEGHGEKLFNSWQPESRRKQAGDKHRAFQVTPKVIQPF